MSVSRTNDRVMSVKLGIGETVVNIICALRASQEVFAMSTGRRPPGDKDTWWWNDEVK